MDHAWYHCWHPSHCTHRVPTRSFFTTQHEGAHTSLVPIEKYIHIVSTWIDYISKIRLAIVTQFVCYFFSSVSAYPEILNDLLGVKMVI